MVLHEGLPFLHRCVLWVCMGLILFSVFLLIYTLTHKGAKVKYVCRSPGAIFHLGDTTAAPSPYQVCYNVDFPITVYDYGSLPKPGSAITLISDDADLMKRATTKPPPGAVLLSTIGDLYGMNQALRLNVCPVGNKDQCLNNAGNLILQFAAQCGNTRGSFPCFPKSKDADGVAAECRSFGRLPGLACDASKDGCATASPRTRLPANGGLYVCQALAGAMPQGFHQTLAPCSTTCCDT